MSVIKRVLLDSGSSAGEKQFNRRGASRAGLVAAILCVCCSVLGGHRLDGTGAAIDEPHSLMARELLRNGSFEDDGDSESIAPWIVSWYKGRRGGSRAVRTRIGTQDGKGHAVELTRPPVHIRLTQEVTGIEKAAPSPRLVAEVSAVASAPAEVALDVVYTSVTGEHKRVGRVYHPGDGEWHRLTIDKYLPYSLYVSSISFRILRQSESDGRVLVDDASLKLLRSDWSRVDRSAASQDWRGIVLLLLLLAVSWGWRAWQNRRALAPTTADGAVADGQRRAWLPQLWASPKLRARLTVTVAAVLLWVFAYHTFHSHPTSSYYRLDRKEAVAYPGSDAAYDFGGALAILTGDGWVYWREHYRWSSFRPGWSAFLAGVGYLAKRDPGRMQFLITLLLCSVAPLFYLSVIALFKSRKTHIVAFVAALLFVMYPQCVSWRLQHSMMTEGPTLLLAIAACTVGVRACSRRRWRWFEGLILGALMAAVCMTRPQALYAAAAVFAVVVLAAWPRFRARIRFLLLLACGFIAVCGPFFLKTSIHLGYPYTGVSYTSLKAVLQWTEPGRAVGGHLLEPDQMQTEGQAINILSERAKEAVRINLRQPARVFKEAIQHYHAYSLANLAKVFRTSVWSATFTVVAWCLVGLGVLLAVARAGPAGAIPLIFSLGYIAPQVALSVFAYHGYWGRYGMPISWPAMAYGSGVLLLAVDPTSAKRSLLRLRVAWRRLTRRLRRLHRGLRKPRVQEPRIVHQRQGPALRPWHYWLPALLLAGWVGGCTAGLVLYDTGPPPPNDADAFLAHPQTRLALADADIKVDDALHDAIRTAFEDGEQTGLVRLGRAFLPFTVEPGDPDFWHWTIVLKPQSKTYTTFDFLVPWKMGGDGRSTRVDVDGRLYQGFRHGDEVVLILAAKDAWPHVEAVIPTHWPDSQG